MGGSIDPGWTQVNHDQGDQDRNEKTQDLGCEIVLLALWQTQILHLSFFRPQGRFKWRRSDRVEKLLQQYL